MAENRIPNWQGEIEAILREKYQGDELLTQLRQANAILALANEVGVPSGDTGATVALILKWASDELHPLAAIYVGFRLGVAFERYQNAIRIRKP